MDEIIYLIQKFLTFIPVPFLALVNISITAGWIVLAVLLLRFLFRKAPKWLSCALWGIVALRLVFPFSIESVFSLIPSAQTIDPTLPYLNEFTINSGIEPLDNAVNTQYADFVPMAEKTVDVTIILACVWLAGIAAMLIYAFVSWAKLRHSLRTATRKEGNIYQSELVKSPFVLGVIKPRIYIPYKVNEDDLPLVIAHEQAHIKRFDYLFKPLGFLILSVHWFNPLLWIAYVLLCRDIESACDEKVIKDLTAEQRRVYSTALLNASISRKSIAACPIAFGETGVKERIKGVMSYKKPALWVVIAAVLICVVTAVCFLTNPKDKQSAAFYDNGQRIKITVEINGTVTEEKLLFMKEGQNTELSNGTKLTVAETNLQTGETELTLKDPLLTDESGKTIGKMTFFVTDEVSCSTRDGKMKINISCLGVKPLEEYISEEIIEYNRGKYLSGEYVCEANAELSTQITKKDKSGNIKEITAYLVAMYQEYSLENGQIVEKGGSIIPVALTFAVSDDGGYSLTEYWEPGMGRGYITNLKAKFPKGVDYDTQTYVESLNRICQHKASEYFGVEFNTDSPTQEHTTTAFAVTEKDTLYNTIESAIIRKNSAMVYKGDFSCAAFEILKSETASDKAHGEKIKLYLLTCYESFSFSGNAPEVEGAVAEAAVLTLAKNKNGTYSQIEYYVPVKGDDSEESKILNKLVFEYEGQDLSEICLQKAKQHFGVNTTTVKADDVNGVTADISPEAELSFSGKIKEMNDGTILVEVGYNDDGIPEGSLAYVRLATLLSYAPDVDSLNLKNGDYILVVYDGRIMETYPLQVDAYAIYKAVT